MANYDVNDRIPARILINSILSREGEFAKLDQLLRQIINQENYRSYYFNYGRNALRHIFNKMKFKGKKIIFPAFICPSLAYSAIACGVQPEFADVNLDDFNILISSLNELEFENVAAVCAVHTFGFPFDINKILKLKKENGFYLIEDMAHSIFARENNQFAGNFGDFVLISMCKQIPNFQGSVLFSKFNLEGQEGTKDRPSLIDSIKLCSGPQQYLLNLLRSSKDLPKESTIFLREQGYPSNSAVYNFTHLLGNLEDSVKKKRLLAKYYMDRLRTNNYLIPQKSKSGSEPSWFNFNVRLKPDLQQIRDQLLIELRKKNIFCNRSWYMLPVFLKEFQVSEDRCPNAKLLSRTIINLPFKPNYSKEDVDYLFDRIEETINKII